jgi:hypothetical protein
MQKSAETRSSQDPEVQATSGGDLPSQDATPVPSPHSTPPKTNAPREIGGPSGPEPTRYGDWERKGRCIDF